MTIGERIKMARKARGMTKKELAKRIGATEEAIRIFESDRVCPGEYTLKNIAYAMQMDVNVLRGNPGDQTAKRDECGEYRYLGQRPQKCSCCARNPCIKDCYERG